MLQSANKNDNNPNLDKVAVQKILNSVPFDRGFHFFSDVGKYTGETAVNLFSFREELRTIELQSVRFHFGRRDFQNWVKGTLGDMELAERMDRIDAKLSDERLKRELIMVVQVRFEELQTLLKAL